MVAQQAHGGRRATADITIMKILGQGTQWTWVEPNPFSRH